MYDVAIMGGGLAGLTLAVHLKQTQERLRIVVVERNSFPAPHAAHKVGESTVELGAHYLSKTLELKSYLEQKHLPKFGLRFFFGSGALPLEQRYEFGAKEYLPVGSYQLDRGKLENKLAEVATQRGVELMDGVAVTDVELGTFKKICLRHRSTTFPKEIDAKWLVDASGRSFFLGRRLNLTQKTPHVAHSCWWRIKETIDIAELATSESWSEAFQGAKSRHLSTNHFMGQGYWIWVIPLVGGKTSIGIVAENQHVSISELNSFEKSCKFLREREPRLYELLERTERLDFRIVKSYSHDCSEVFSKENWCISGEAGIFVDPFYSPGTDFIAISNSLIVDLITRQKSIGAGFYNYWYRKIAANFMLSYVHQYSMWGDPLVMSIKIIWDYVVYWSVIAFLFCQGKISDVSVIIRFGPDLESLEVLNGSMQKLFRDWHKERTAGKRREPAGFVDISSNQYLWKLNESLVADISEENFSSAFGERLVDLKSVAAEICAFVEKNSSLVIPTMSEESRSHVSALLSEINDVCGA
jgi:flavin-dependent dehydrogenase